MQPKFCEPLEVFLSDFSDCCQWSGVTGSDTKPVLFDEPDGEVLSRRANSRGYKITFRASDFVGIQRGDAILVKNQTFSVLQVNSLDDGAFFEAQLQT